MREPGFYWVISSAPGRLRDPLVAEWCEGGLGRLSDDPYWLVAGGTEYPYPDETYQVIGDRLNPPEVKSGQ